VTKREKEQKAEVPTAVRKSATRKKVVHLVERAAEELAEALARVPGPLPNVDLEERTRQTVLWWQKRWGKMAEPAKELYRQKNGRGR
jgi:hypothetical protein